MPTPNDSCHHTPRVPTPDYPTDDDFAPIIDVAGPNSVTTKITAPADILDELAAELSALGRNSSSPQMETAGDKIIVDEFFEAFPTDQRTLNNTEIPSDPASDLASLLGDDYLLSSKCMKIIQVIYYINI